MGHDPKRRRVPGGRQTPPEKRPIRSESDQVQIGAHRRAHLVPGRREPAEIRQEPPGFYGDFTANSDANRPSRQRERGYGGRFCGALRVNVEAAPRLPGYLLGRIYDYGRPVDLRWESDVQADVFALRAVRFESKLLPAKRFVQIWQSGGAQAWLLRVLPAPNGGRQTLVRCPECDAEVRHLYPYAIYRGLVHLSSWHCRRCGGLRYRSEGSPTRGWGPYPRSWTYGDPEATPVEQAEEPGT